MRGKPQARALGVVNQDRSIYMGMGSAAPQEPATARGSVESTGAPGWEARLNGQNPGSASLLPGVIIKERRSAVKALDQFHSQGFLPEGVFRLYSKQSIWGLSFASP